MAAQEALSDEYGDESDDADLSDLFEDDGNEQAEPAAEYQNRGAA